MEKKVTALQQILSVMDENDVEIAEISAALRARQHPKVDESFDLLIKRERDGRLQRVPFEAGKNLAPIGIFPRSSLKFFIELDETPMVEFPGEIEKNNLLDEEMATLVHESRDELNERLRELGKPILSGDYWLNGHELPGHIGYWMARFRDGRLKVDYFDAERRAKIRYFGRFTD